MRFSKRYVYTVLSLFGLGCLSTAAVPQGSSVQLPKSNTVIYTEAQLTKQAKQKIGLFSSSLKKTLIEAIQSKGFPHAVNVCKTEAPKIAQQLSTDGWKVARTSLKVRNSNNQADRWEAQMLNNFNSAYKAGRPVAELSAIKQSDKTFRYMQAIPTGQVCLACHGQTVEPALLETIRTHYPQDAATGFTLEDIRGAFTLSKALEQ